MSDSVKLQGAAGTADLAAGSSSTAVLSGHPGHEVATSSAAVTLFAATLFVNALLLFLVQPMFAKLVLPLLGGSPSVWTACMLFFQSVLLAGYLYAHAAERLLTTRGQAVAHAVVWWLPFLVLPIGLPSDLSAIASTGPVTWLLRTSLISVGLPFFVLSTSAPLLQKWFSQGSHGRTSDPYFLYAASNAGSLAALLLYPIVVERLLPMRSQAGLWTFGYAVSTVVVLACAVVTWRTARGEQGWAKAAAGAAAVHTPGIAIGRRLRWLLLAFVPSSLMLAVTSYASTDVAPVPLLWTVPLALYLVTFIATFSRGAAAYVSVARRVLPFVLLPLLVSLLTGIQPPLWVTLPVHLATFLALAMLCHGALAADRPAVDHLTEFYLWVSAGGMAGGLFNTVVAPRLFTSVAEYPLVLAIGCLSLAIGGPLRELLASPRLWKRPAMAGFLVAVALITARTVHLPSAAAVVPLGVAAIVCFTVARDAARFGVAVAAVLAANALFGGFDGNVLYASRTFFGIYRVTTVGEPPHFVTLSHGTTIHGRQHWGVAVPEPLTYYSREGPIGDLFATRVNSPSLSVGVVGLGVGSMAAYAEAGQRWQFYEIDPEIEKIARDARFFHYLERCGRRCTVLIGDARLTLQAQSVSHDVIVLDAFSSDAIPLHLLTREAVGIYLSRLASGGVLAIHITNRHLNLELEVARLMRAHGLTARIRRDDAPPDASGRARSHWVVAGREAADLRALNGSREWSALEADSAPSWTDDFSNLWSVIRWRRSTGS